MYILRSAPRFVAKMLPVVAVCIAGVERDFAHPIVWRNIHAAMVAPLGEQADVFFSVGESSDAALAIARTHFQAVDAERRPPSWLASARTRAQRALLSHTSCWPLVVRHERTVRKNVQYSWVLRLRSDVIYAYPMPPLHAWPSNPSSVAYVEYCHQSSRGLGRPNATGHCSRYLPHNHKFGRTYTFRGQFSASTRTTQRAPAVAPSAF